MEDEQAAFIRATLRVLGRVAAAFVCASGHVGVPLVVGGDFNRDLLRQPPCIDEGTAFIPRGLSKSGVGSGADENSSGGGAVQRVT